MPALVDPTRFAGFYEHGPGGWRLAKSAEVVALAFSQSAPLSPQSPFLPEPGEPSITLQSYPSYWRFPEPVAIRVTIGGGHGGMLEISGAYKAFPGCERVIQEAVRGAANRIDIAINLISSYPEGVCKYANDPLVANVNNADQIKRLDAEIRDRLREFGEPMTLGTSWQWSRNPPGYEKIPSGTLRIESLGP